NNNAGKTKKFQLRVNEEILAEKEFEVSYIRPKIQGYLDGIDGQYVYGWAWDPENPEKRLEVVVYVDNEPIAIDVANLYREDLSQVSVGDGRYGFRIKLPTDICKGERIISVRTNTTPQIELSNSPIKYDFSLDYISHLFDFEWYSRKYGLHFNDIYEAFNHWLKEGIKNNFNPHPLFDVVYYLSQTDKRVSNPLLHFLETGVNEGLNPNPFFNVKYYIENNPDVKKSGINPLIHYILYGEKENRKPHPAFDPDYYRQKYKVEGSPLIHYLEVGRHLGFFKNEEEEKIYNQILKLKEQKKNHIDKKNEQKCEEDKKTKEILKKIIKKDLLISFPDIFSEIDEKIELISVDVWNTLLFRLCDPEEVKLNSGRFLLIKYYHYIKPAFRSVQSLYKLRKFCEDTCSHTNDFEYRYEEAIVKMLNLAFEKGVPETIIKRAYHELLETELKFESLCVVPNTSLVQALTKNYKKFKFIFTSDFYHKSNFIWKILERFQISNLFINGYVSCDYLINKRTGQMFEQIRSDHKIDYDRIFHIGDNKIADYEIPKKLGIKVFLFRNNEMEEINSFFNEALVDYLNYGLEKHKTRINCLIDLLLDLVDNEISGLDSYEKELIRIGIKVAPLAIGFILNVIENSIRIGVERIYFLTREGVTFKRFYDEIIKYDPYCCFYPQSEILEVSRLSTLLPSLKEFNSSEFFRFWSLYSKQSPEAFISTLNIDHEKVKSFFEKEGLKFDEEIIYPWQNKKFMKILENKEFTDVLKKEHKLQRELLLKYLQQKGINPNDDEPLFLVDIGWRGSIQDNLCYILPNKHIFGNYLGLMRFLNEQPKNSTKFGFLFDFNKNDILPQNIELEVAVLEMIFNSPIGSCEKYIEEKGRISCIKKDEEAEKKVFYNYIQHLQRGIIYAIPYVVEYIRNHALTSDIFKEIGREILTQLMDADNGYELLSEAFFSLAHNEKFGTGKFQDFSTFLLKFKESINKLDGSHLHKALTDIITICRWKKGFQKHPEVKKAISKPILDLPTFFIKENLKGKKIGVYAPGPIRGSGGHRTIFNLVKGLIDCEAEVYVFLENEGEGLHVLDDFLGEGDKKFFISTNWVNSIPLDLAIATIGYSSHYVANIDIAKKKAYFVQDFEAYFNPVGDVYLNIENSYVYDMLHLTIGNWLAFRIINEYGGLAVPSGIGVDSKIYFIDEQIKKENAICFLYQPEKPRRNSFLGIEILTYIKERIPDVKIYIYGSNSPVQLPFEAENLGLIHDLNKLRELYNKCKVCLCMSMTNPSRIPFEAMACGCVPVDLYRFNNLFDYEDGTALLCYQSIKSIADGIIYLLENEKEFRERRQKCVEFVSSRSLEWEVDRHLNAIMRYLNNKEIPTQKPKIKYKEPPFISKKEMNIPGIIKFCNYQRRLAEGV
ncbi:MAG: glycosyltransferase, partial [Candidatus Aenigmatarchaeota archaeon]